MSQSRRKIMKQVIKILNEITLQEILILRRVLKPPEYVK